LGNTLQIGLFCGTFNPIHNAHLLLAQCACEQFQLKQIYFVTSPRPPHRQDALLPAEVRHKMVLLAVAENDKFIPSAVELERIGPSFTIDTIKYFQENLQNKTGNSVKINLLLGGDNVLQLPSWHKFEDIIAQTKLLIAPRWADRLGNKQTPTDRPGDAALFTAEEQAILSKTDHGFIEFPLIDISSTYVRQCLKEGKSARYLVPELVWQLIVQDKIFQQ
jgi:nicotinate-nucleotide adenylyltransferase